MIQVKITIREKKPTKGSWKIFKEGKKAIRSRATPAMGPKSPARGTERRIIGPRNDAPLLINPTTTMTPMEIFQARRPSWVAT
jgi:hypothetical protein